jgi:TBPIP/Hop2 winged helix domain
MLLHASGTTLPSSDTSKAAIARMAQPSITQVEERVEQLLCGANKPFSVQTITDNLAQYGIKKGQVQKAAEMLAAEGGTITAKVKHCIALIVDSWQVRLTAGRDLCPLAAGIRQDKIVLPFPGKYSSSICRGDKDCVVCCVVVPILILLSCSRAADLLVGDITWRLISRSLTQRRPSRHRWDSRHLS